MTIETLESNGFTATLDYDSGDGQESPREYETSTFFGFHRSYGSPDSAPDSDPDKARKIAESADNICLPVWLYAHSGTIYKAAETNPFSCKWDSGLFGFIYISKADTRLHFDVARVTKHVRQCMLRDLALQVDTFSQWANGEFYRWDIADSDGDYIESCGGYCTEDEARAAMVKALEAIKKEST